jgi:hypothetical protein
MSNVTKTQKRDKLRSQLAQTLAELQKLTQPKPTMGDYFDRRSRHRVYQEKAHREANLKKKAAMLNRKLSLLEEDKTSFG